MELLSHGAKLQTDHVNITKSANVNRCYYTVSGKK